MGFKRFAAAVAALSVIAVSAQAACSVGYTCVTEPLTQFKLSTDVIPVTLTGTSDLFFYGTVSKPLTAVLGDLTSGSNILSTFAFSFGSPLGVTEVTGLTAGTYDFNLFGVSLLKGASATLGYSVSAIPEPATYALLFAGLGLVAYKITRRRSSNSGAVAA
jgi:hypothetical protein